MCHFHFASLPSSGHLKYSFRRNFFHLSVYLSCCGREVNLKLQKLFAMEMEELRQLKVY